LPKKIENPIREGIASKVYLVAYPEPILKYRIAKKVYEKEIKPPASKIYGENGVIAQLKKINAIDVIKTTNSKIDARRGHPYLSKVDPLIPEIEKELGYKDFELDEKEKDKIYRFLDSDEFRKLIGHVKITGISKRDVDAAGIIIERLGDLASRHHCLNLASEISIERGSILSQFPEDMRPGLFEWQRPSQETLELLRLDYERMKKAFRSSDPVSLASLILFELEFSPDLLRKLALLADPTHIQENLVLMAETLKQALRVYI